MPAMLGRREHAPSAAHGRRCVHSVAWLLVLTTCFLGACRRDVPAGAPRVSLDPVSLSESVFEVGGDVDVVESPKGMVVSGHELASRVGADVLARGGNAIDAAVATGFALAVVLPRAGNIGGGGFLVYRSAEGEVLALDYREKAPGTASRDMYLDDNGDPTNKSVVGHLAPGVPGSVAGLWAMHERLGALPWPDLLAPAVALANGHILDAVRADDIGRARAQLAMFEASVEAFLVDGEAPAAGSTWRQPDLAGTLESIAERGRAGFYQGETADRIVNEMTTGGGLITREDLLSYEPVWREPIELDYRGRRMYTMPPPSSGGVALAMIFNFLEGWEDLPDPGTAELVHLEVEAMRRAFIDRNHWLGDPDFVDMPIERLCSEEYAAELRAAMATDRATPTDQLSPATYSLVESSETTHYVVVDEAGNAASITTTLNGSFGSFVTVTGAGFLLNNEMDDFAAAPGRANMYGLVQGEANAIQPGKRMLSSMTPTITLDPSGNLEMLVGTPGGPTIITTVFQVLSNVIDHDMTLGQAVAAPRLHHQALPDQVFFERGGLSESLASALLAMGHEATERDGLSGNVSAIRRHGDVWQGVADPRRAGAAAAP